MTDLDRAAVAIAAAWDEQWCGNRTEELCAAQGQRCESCLAYSDAVKAVKSVRDNS